jgi:hypothetical protein
MSTFIFGNLLRAQSFGCGGHVSWAVFVWIYVLVIVPGLTKITFDYVSSHSHANGIITYSFLFLRDPKEFRHSHASPNHARCLEREVAPQDEESEGGNDRQVHQPLFKEVSGLENSSSSSRKKIRLIPVLGGNGRSWQTLRSLRACPASHISRVLVTIAWSSVRRQAACLL